MSAVLARDGRKGRPVSAAFALNLSRNLVMGLQRAGLIAFAAALLLWPAVVNGRPALFPDTALYFSEAEYLMEALGVVAPGHGVVPVADPTRLPEAPGAPNVSAGIDGGRSPVWASFLYLLQRAGGVWLVAYVQACAAAFAVYGLYRVAAPRAPLAGYLTVMGGLAVASSLPVFATLMMPDVFAGVAAVCALTALVYWDRLGLVKRIALLALLVFSIMAHGSNAFVAAIFAVLGGALLAFSGVGVAQALKRSALVLLAAFIAVGGMRLAYQPMQARAGEVIGSPPFLSARVLADGPARAYLRRACDRGQVFALCRFARQPLANSDEILWSRMPGRAVFTLSDVATTHQLEREDLRFALSALLADPLGQAAASLRNAAEQLVLADVSDSFDDQRTFVTDGYWRRTSLPKIMPDAAACTVRGRCAPRVPSIAVSVLVDAVLAVSILFVGWRLAGSDMRASWRSVWERRSEDDDRARMIRLALLALGLLLANAAVCGVLSGPFPRYQARMAWIAPMVAGLMVARLGTAVSCRRRNRKY